MDVWILYRSSRRRYLFAIGLGHFGYGLSFGEEDHQIWDVGGVEYRIEDDLPRNRHAFIVPGTRPVLAGVPTDERVSVCHIRILLGIGDGPYLGPIFLGHVYDLVLVTIGHIVFPQYAQEYGIQGDLTGNRESCRRIVSGSVLFHIPADERIRVLDVGVLCRVFRKCRTLSVFAGLFEDNRPLRIVSDGVFPYRHIEHGVEYKVPVHSVRGIVPFSTAVSACIPTYERIDVLDVLFLGWRQRDVQGFSVRLGLFIVQRTVQMIRYRIAYRSAIEHGI